MGEPCTMSSALPCGTPSTTSNITTSPSSLRPASKAKVPPIWPAPTSAILLRAMGMSSSWAEGEMARVLPRNRKGGKVPGRCSRLFGDRPLGLPTVPDVDDFDNRTALAIGQHIGCNHQPSRARRVSARRALRKFGKLLLSGSDPFAEALRGGRVALRHIGNLSIELLPRAPDENNSVGH